MSRTIPDQLRATSISRLMLVGLLSSVAISAMATSGCQKSKKTQAKELIEDRVKVCRNKKETTFYTVGLVGDEEKRVLQSTCNKEIGEVTMPDEFTGQATVGPYTWQAGLQKTTGTWVLKAAKWEALDRALRILDRDDLSADEFKRAATHLGKAIEDYPESSWLRTKRLDVLLDYRTRDRDLTKESGADLGDLIRSHLDETVAWSNEQGDSDLAAKSHLAIVNYYATLADEADKRREDVPAPNEETIEVEKLKGAMEASKKQGNDKQVEQYKQQLENLRKERPKKKEHFKKMVRMANTKRCGFLSKISLSGIKDSDLQSSLESAKQSTDCESLLKRDSAQDTDPSDDSQ
jgi:hypothetical protein